MTESSQGSERGTSGASESSDFETDEEYDDPGENSVAGETSRGRGRPKIVRSGLRGRSKKVYQTKSNQVHNLEELLKGTNHLKTGQSAVPNI